MPKLGGIKFVKIMTKGHSRLLGWTLKLLCAKFVPPSYRKEFLLKLQRFHQGSMCMSEYFKELEYQMFRVGIKETNKEKMKRCVNGLRGDIQDQVELYEYSTLQNVFTLALRIETHLKRKNKARKSYSPNNYYRHSWKGKAKENHDKSPSKSHQAPSSKNKSPSGHTHHSTSQRSSSIKCFKCLGYKHIALNCPIKRKMILKKSDDESEHFSSSSPQNTSSHTSSSIERTKPLESGLLMVRCQLGQVPKELDPSQRQNLFHGGCLMKD